MAISANTREILHCANMVLYVDITFQRDTGRMDNYVAEIHKATAADFKAYPSLPVGLDTILHSHGTGIEELQATLAYLTFLLGNNPAQDYRKSVVSRLLQCETCKPKTLILCYKICNKGVLQDVRLPSSRLATFLTLQPSQLVHKTVPPAGENLRFHLSRLKRTARVISK